MYVISGYCTQCGSPIYTESPWFSILPPPNRYSCNCFSFNVQSTRITDSISTDDLIPSTSSDKLEVKLNYTYTLKNCELESIEKKNELNKYDFIELCVK